MRRSRVEPEGEEHESTLLAANNYADSLRALQHFEDARSLLRKAMPVARRVLGESDDLTLRISWNYARSVCEDTCPTLAELREAVTTLEETDRIARSSASVGQVSSQTDRA